MTGRRIGTGGRVRGGTGGPARTGTAGRLSALLLGGALLLTACGGDDSSEASGGDGGGSGSGESASASGGGGEASDVRVGLAYDIGGRGDQSFNDSAAAGLDRATSELGVEARELSPNADGTDRDDNLRLLAESGFNPVVAVGFAYAEGLGEIASEFPDTQFAIIDDASLEDTENVTSLVFAEEQGSFLVGAAAGLLSASGTVGFVGGVEVPLIEKFEAGYAAGVAEVAPDTAVEVRYLSQPPDFSGFTSPDLGRTAAGGLYDAGADIVFHAAGGSGLGVFQAAEAAGGRAIGVDSDQYESVEPPLNEVIVTSMVKRVDNAVFEFVDSVAQGDPLTGVQTFDLERGGVDYSTSGGAVDEIAPQLDELKQRIVSGDITVPSTTSAG